MLIIKFSNMLPSHESVCGSGCAGGYLFAR